MSAALAGRITKLERRSRKRPLEKLTDAELSALIVDLADALTTGSEGPELTAITSAGTRNDDIDGSEDTSLLEAWRALRKCAGWPAPPSPLHSDAH